VAMQSKRNLGHEKSRYKSSYKWICLVHSKFIKHGVSEGKNRKTGSGDKYCGPLGHCN
jgi:hypothetical protein